MPLYKSIHQRIQMFQRKTQAKFVETCNTTVSMRKTTTCRIESYIRHIVSRILWVYCHIFGSWKVACCRICSIFPFKWNQFFFWNSQESEWKAWFDFVGLPFCLFSMSKKIVLLIQFWKNEQNLHCLGCSTSLVKRETE